MKTACSLFFFGMMLGAAQAPSFSPAGPEAQEYGLAEHFPIGTMNNAFEKKYMVATFSHWDTLFTTHPIAPSSHAWEFQAGTMPEELKSQINDYLKRIPVTGLLVAKSDKILFEGYQYGRTDHDQFTSQSMAKTVVAMLVGIAVSDHSISSVHDAATKYVSELKGSDYGKATIEDLLHMSSGVNCRMGEELYDVSVQDFAQKCQQAAPPNTRFRYSGADAQILGTVLEHAVSKPLAQYLQEKLWQNMGTESKASWGLNAAGQELAFCCLNASLRDYARLGRLLAADGSWDGSQLIPKQWILDGTTLKDATPQLQPGKPAPFFGYGYQLWIFPGPRRMFALLGANGQRIFVDPQSKLIMVQTAVIEKAIDLEKDRDTIHVWLRLVHQLGS